MWRQVTDEVSWVLTEDDSAWRRAARLSSYLLLWAAPRNFPLCHHAENYEKADRGSELKGRNLHNQNITCALPGTGHRHRCRCRSPLSCAVMWKPTSRDRRVWKDPSCEVGLCSPSNVASWPGLSPDGWAAEQVWSWSAVKPHKRLLFRNAGPAWGHGEQNAFLTNCFTEVLNWRPARIQYT